MAGTVETATTYSSWMGLLYVFNLIVGTGALALPRAFQQAGYILSIAILAVSAGASYISATFVLESLATGNAVQHRRRKCKIKGRSRESVADYHRGGRKALIVSMAYDSSTFDFTTLIAVVLKEIVPHSIRNGSKL
ncbi:unnamed protein product [Strongylus vulgaris]|uniref:Amino acid transporter transmembrane domain-containing protein n=1 Tax=Strongylus vulgaris TaxID=40348 RepID=A0A3P7J1Q5_STRVU|nr:unnamed protein product [Strongylus vulgaris]